MVTKTHKSGASKAGSATAASPLSGAIKDSAQQIWLAGLGAFSKAQAEGGKAFETLVKEGLTIQRKTQAVAEERINEATQRMSSMANDIGNKAAGRWDKLENIFEERVAKALNKLGVPSARDIEALIERIDALSAAVVGQSGKADESRSPAQGRRQDRHEKLPSRPARHRPARRKRPEARSVRRSLGTPGRTAPLFFVRRSCCNAAFPRQQAVYTRSHDALPPPFDTAF